MTDHVHDPDVLSDGELDRLLLDAHTDLLRYAREHTDPLTGLLVLMEDDTTPPQPEPTHDSHDLVILELRALTRHTRRRLPEGIAELHHALVRANLPHPNSAYLAFLMTLTQAIITVSDISHELARDRDLARDLALGLTRDLARDLKLALGRNLTRPHVRTRDRVLNHALTLARDLFRDLALTLAHDLDLALDLARDRVLNHVLTLDRALDGALAMASDLDLPRDLTRDLARVLTRTRTRGLDHDLDHGLTMEVADILVRAVASALASVPVNLSGVDASHLPIMDLEALAGTVWNRATTWPVNLRELVEQHSEQIGDGMFQVRGGTERDPHGSVLA
ncbi:hypothetical protein GCM10022254_40120 [Actinomadura meridiana]|uniref:Uncharacterized protein n=1 Tax=Actinomadura meridiana TaxID=559626 RepID=A0ABP8C6Q4_9ACTN